MKLRQLIAAATALLFLTIWCGPAFAGVRALVTTPADGGCCCSEQETTKHQTVQDLPCRCSSCACSLTDGQPFAPMLVNTAASASMHALPGAPVALEHAAAGTLGAHTTLGARGPPANTSPPLYLLYDTWLI